MPDITMCAATDCAMSKVCYRHRDSGTEPSEFWQAFCNFQKENDESGDVEDCIWYWPVEKQNGGSSDQ